MTEVTLHLPVQPGGLRLEMLRHFTHTYHVVEVDTGARRAVERCYAAIGEILSRDEAVYGLNTGFGQLANVRIAPDKIAELQRNLVLSHAVGTGSSLDDSTVALAMLLKVAALAHGHSGVRWKVIETLLGLLNAGVLPLVPAKGSVGASGDLAPLAHISAALLGVGEVRYRGEVLPAAEGLRLAGLTPLELGPKEGLALLNGTQVSTALALEGLFRAEGLLATALVTGALSVEAARGSDTPFDARIHALRRQVGQAKVARTLARFLVGSEIRRSHVDCDRVQDPYSLRCQPQVMGACLDHLSFAAEILERESNAVTDNPLVFPETGEILSGGNFHAEPVAMVADVMALVLAEIGALAERRVALLVDSTVSGLPPFLVRESGLNSGFMAVQITAAALASENKSLAHPASVDSLPTSANQEDHVSMATFAARRLAEMADNVAGILAIELLAAAEGVAFHAPLRTSPLLQGVVATLREVVPSIDSDRFLAPDLARAKALVTAGTFVDLADAALLPSRSRA